MAIGGTASFPWPELPFARELFLDNKKKEKKKKVIILWRKVNGAGPAPPSSQPVAVQWQHTFFFNSFFLSFFFLAIFHRNFRLLFYFFLFLHTPRCRGVDLLFFFSFANLSIFLQRFLFLGENFGTSILENVLFFFFFFNLTDAFLFLNGFVGFFFASLSFRNILFFSLNK